MCLRTTASSRVLKYMSCPSKFSKFNKRVFFYQTSCPLTPLDNTGQYRKIGYNCDPIPYSYTKCVPLYVNIRQSKWRQISLKYHQNRLLCGRFSKFSISVVSIMYQISTSPQGFSLGVQ